MRFFVADSYIFLERGMLMLGHWVKHVFPSRRTASKKDIKRFRGAFGCSPDVCCKLWEMTNEVLSPKATIEHLLWALLLIKVYAPESELIALCGNPDEKTFRHWAWAFVEAIADCHNEVVRLVNNVVKEGQVSLVVLTLIHCIFSLCLLLHMPSEIADQTRKQISKRYWQRVLDDNRRN